MKLLDAFKTVNRDCTCGNYEFSVPTADEFAEGEQTCRSCRRVFNIDDEDVQSALAFVIARIEYLEDQIDRLTNPFYGIDL